MITLAVVRHNKVTTKNFSTITDAYKHYVKHYATIQEWFYYFKCSHTLLNRVCDEEIMNSLFLHCFRNACICENRPR